MEARGGVAACSIGVKDMQNPLQPFLRHVPFLPAVRLALSSRLPSCLPAYIHTYRPLCTLALQGSAWVEDLSRVFDLQTSRDFQRAIPRSGVLAPAFALLFAST